MEWAFSEELKEVTSTTSLSLSPSADRAWMSNEILSSSSGYLEDLQYACASSPAAAIVQLHRGSGGTYSLRELLELCLTCGSESIDVRDKI